MLIENSVMTIFLYLSIIPEKQTIYLERPWLSRRGMMTMRRTCFAACCSFSCPFVRQVSRSTVTHSLSKMHCIQTIGLAFNGHTHQHAQVLPPPLDGVSAPRADNSIGPDVPENPIIFYQTTTSYLSELQLGLKIRGRGGAVIIRWA